MLGETPVGGLLVTDTPVRDRGPVSFATCLFICRHVLEMKSETLVPHLCDHSGGGGEGDGDKGTEAVAGLSERAGVLRHGGDDGLEGQKSQQSLGGWAVRTLVCACVCVLTPGAGDKRASGASQNHTNTQEPSLALYNQRSRVYTHL